MAKVVGRDESAVKRVTCGNCASIIEYTGADTRIGEGSDYSGDTWYYDYIECPNCTYKVDV